MTITKTTSAKLVNNQTVAASAELAQANCTAYDTSDAVGLTCGVKLTFNASATQGATVRFYGTADDTNYASVGYPYYEYDIAYGSGIKYASFPIPKDAPKNIKATVLNRDSGQSITAIDVWITKQTL